MNRYSQITTSGFDPLSFEQIAAPAMMKREQHNKALADQEIMIQGLSKVKPGEKFYNEAQRLKSDITSKVNTFGESLAKEGVNSNTQAGMIALNRQYQDLMSPTGKLGMIHENNIATQKAYEDAVQASIKMGNSEAISKQNVAEHFSKYNKDVPMYNEKTGQVIGFDAGSAPKFVDPIAFTDTLAAKANMTSAEWKSAASQLSMDGAGNRFVVDQSSRKVHGSNVPQLQKVADMLNQVTNDPQSELMQSLTYNKRDINAVRKQMVDQLGIYKQSNDITDNSTGKSNVSWYTPPKTDTKQNGSNLEAINVGEVTTISKNEDLLNTLTGKSGTDAFGSAVTKGSNARYGLPTDKVFSSKPQMKRTPEYRDIVNGLNRNLAVNKKYKVNSVEEENAVISYLEKHKNLTIQNRYVDPNTNITGQLFANKNIPKDRKAAREYLWGKIARGASTMVDELGNPIDLGQVNQSEFIYNGDMTPESNIRKRGTNDPIFKDPKQNYMAHTGSVSIGTGKDKKVIPVYISRNSDDFKSPEYQGGVDLNTIANKITTLPGIYHHIKPSGIKGFEKHGLSNIEMKYNPGQKSYDVSYREKDGKGNIAKIDDTYTEAEFNEWIIDLNR